MKPHYILFSSILLFLLSTVLVGYAVYLLKQARVILRKADASTARATKVFQEAQKLRNETRMAQENIRLMLPAENLESVPTLAEMPVLELEMVGADDFELGELRVDPEPEPDYENFQGLPVKENTPAAVIESLRAHGFIVRFNIPTFDVQIAYQKPETTNEPVRATYKPPAEIFPLNNLHEAGKAATALWAAKQFVAQYKFPEFQNYPYL